MALGAQEACSGPGMPGAPGRPPGWRRRFVFGDCGRCARAGNRSR